MDKKIQHYLFTSLTLGAIGAVSALLIGLTNLATRNQIAINEQNKINAGIVEIFGDNAKLKEEKSASEMKFAKTYKYVKDVYSIVDQNDSAIGLAFKTTGSNMYGKISLIVGFSNISETFIGLSIVVDEQTYASTLEDNYIAPLNEGTRELDDVSCGATYGAKLVRDMVNEANEAAEELWEK